MKDASDAVLSEVRLRTRGFPRALEAVVAVLRADRTSTLQDILTIAGNQLPENVVHVLVGEAFNRLDCTAQKVMQALAIYGRPVTHEAISRLLLPYLPGLDVVPALKGLANMYLVRSERGRYDLHPVDLACALKAIPRGADADRQAPQAPFTQIALYHRGAEYFSQARLEAPKSIADYAAQLAEFDLRCAGEDFYTALDLLNSYTVDLSQWGHHQLLVDSYTRLEGKITDIAVESLRLLCLGGEFFSIGALQPAMSCFEKSLALPGTPRSFVGENVGGLGNCHALLGQIEAAAGYYERALAIYQELGDQAGEAKWLGNLGNCHVWLGHTQAGIQCYEHSLRLSREKDDKHNQAHRLENLSHALIDEGRFEEAAQRAVESVELANALAYPIVGSWGCYSLAAARLYAADLDAAREAAEAALQYDEPSNNFAVSTLLGIVAWRQHDGKTARDAFLQAIRSTDEILGRSRQYWRALDMRGLACCGLALCEDNAANVAKALQAFKAARSITRAAGIVGRAKALFSVLAETDSKGLLCPVRALLSA